MALEIILTKAGIGIRFNERPWGDGETVFRHAGDLAAHRDQFDAESSIAHYEQALALAQSHGMRPLVAHCYLGASKLYRRAGKPEQARESLTAATTMYRDGNGLLVRAGNADVMDRVPSSASIRAPRRRARIGACGLHHAAVRAVEPAAEVEGDYVTSGSNRHRVHRSEPFADANEVD